MIPVEADQQKNNRKSRQEGLGRKTVDTETS